MFYYTNKLKCYRFAKLKPKLQTDTHTDTKPKTMVLNLWATDRYQVAQETITFRDATIQLCSSTRVRYLYFITHFMLFAQWYEDAVNKFAFEYTVDSHFFYIYNIPPFPLYSLTHTWQFTDSAPAALSSKKSV